MYVYYGTHFCYDMEHRWEEGSKTCTWLVWVYVYECTCMHVFYSVYFHRGHWVFCVSVVQHRKEKVFHLIKLEMFQNAPYYTEVFMHVCMPEGGHECMYIMHMCVCVYSMCVRVCVWATSCWSVCSCLRFSSSPLVSFSLASSSLDLISSDSCKNQSQD